MQHAAFLLTLVLAAGCGSPAPLEPSRGNLVSGGGRVRAGAITLDVELGQRGFAVAAGGVAADSAQVTGGAR
jgi:hypothetical protein